MSSLAENLFHFANVMKQIEEKDGEISNEILPILTHAEICLANKVDSYVNFRDVVQAQIDRTKKNIENFKKNLQTLEKLEERLKSNVKHLMEAHDLLEIEGNKHSIKLVNSGGIQATEKPTDMFYQLECIDEKYEEELSDYIQPKCIFVIKDKEKFKEAVKNNKFKSIYLLPRGKHVRFM